MKRINNNVLPCSLFCLGAPSLAYASDFNRLFVGMAAVVISVILLVLCGVGASAASNKPRNEVMGYSFGSLVLSIIGLVIVFDEAHHMNDSDTYWLIGMIAVPGVLAFVLPLLLSKPISQD